MKVVEFQGSVAANGQIEVPAQLANQIPAGEPVQVVVMWGTADADDAWKMQARQRFEAAYASDDSVFDQLI